MSFGRGKENGTTDPLSQSEPIAIDLGQGLRFRLAGQIDRIDQVGPSSFEIIDYKTGGYFENDWRGIFSGGRRLQHALYGLAAVEILKRKYRSPEVVGGTYYFSSHKGQQRRKQIVRQSTVALTEVLSDLRQVIASGTFIHAADDSACKWCEFGRACGSSAKRQAAAKKNDPTLRAYRKLVEHE